MSVTSCQPLYEDFVFVVVAVLRRLTFYPPVEKAPEVNRGKAFDNGGFVVVVVSGGGNGGGGGGRPQKGSPSRFSSGEVLSRRRER